VAVENSFQKVNVRGEEAREKTCWKCGRTFMTAERHCPHDGARLLDITLGDDHDPLIGQQLDRRYDILHRLG